jgi:geranylgeranyl diphosphate synthase type I
VSLQEALDQFLPQIERELQRVVQAPHHSLGAYYGMMRYHLGWVDGNLQPVEADSGKRLRPMLCLLCCEAAGGDPEQALPAAAALELVHNFSLVHDDIQDASKTRRGRRTVWDIWGQAQGINVGDGLFVLARQALHRLGERNVPLQRQHAAIIALDEACLALCEGQYFDMIFEDHVDVDLDQYLWMIRHKTAALLAASAQLGAIIATFDETQIDDYHRFGENLGMAFQIQDDILGTWGDPSVTGKSAATDIRDRKKTLPVVYALRHRIDPEAVLALAELYAPGDPLDENEIRCALALLDRVGARAYAEEMAEAYYHQAIHDLERTRIENEAQTRLRALAASLLGRTV